MLLTSCLPSNNDSGKKEQNWCRKLLRCCCCCCCLKREKWQREVVSISSKSEEIETESQEELATKIEEEYLAGVARTTFEKSLSWRRSADSALIRIDYWQTGLNGSDAHRHFEAIRDYAAKALADMNNYGPDYVEAVFQCTEWQMMEETRGDNFSWFIGSDEVVF